MVAVHLIVGGKNDVQEYITILATFTAVCRWGEQEHGLPGALADLLGAERADAIQTKAENHPVFLAETDVERRKLTRHRATIPTVTNCDCRADE